MAKRKPKSIPPQEPGPARFGFSAVAPSEERRVAVPKPVKVDRSSLINALKGFGEGFDEELEQLLQVPEKLYLTTGGAYRHYSKDEKGGIGFLMQGLQVGKLYAPDTEFGVVLYETASTIYVVIADSKRRVVVRGRLQCLYDEEMAKDWAPVKEDLKAALSLASSKEAQAGGLYAVADGTLKLMKPEPLPQFGKFALADD
ncbi:MAG: hypothetical protein AB1324_05565 [Candidatus Micrarchaeota archaeon]